MSFRPAPFYWWAGEPLRRERLAWQLDRLREQGVGQVIISYPHKEDGTTDLGDPPLFSPEWWELFRWFLGECRGRGMTAGIQDYTLVGPALQEVGRSTPGMQGGQISCVWARIAGPAAVNLAMENSSWSLGAWAYPVSGGVPQASASVELTSFIDQNTLRWQAPPGEWLAVHVFVRPGAFDPLHPESGRRAIERLYAPFERECPGEVGSTMKVFFQDELDFGGRMPFYSSCLRRAFQEQQGYDLWPLLAALWLDLGNLTAKVRLDYAEVVTGEIERNYFQPVFQWHEKHGTLFGNDNLGRGQMRRGREHYGDYFRAMRWYSAPGCDDPKIRGARSFQGLKVNSSIAHLYQRPRVWLEAFHSSGWGTTPAEVVGAMNEDLACGANLVNLHGLYYTTRGSWWEWAAPDFHFRQPYWQHFGPLTDYFTRLSWLLTQGTHRCDVAILYPSAALDAEAASVAPPALHAHMGNGSGADSGVFATDPEQVAGTVGKYLFDRACDFDFIDFESLDRAKTADGQLQIEAEAYRVLVLPAMAAIRLSSLEAAQRFVRAGGLVIACGALPCASERGGNDESLVQMVADLFQPQPSQSGGRGVFVPNSCSEVLRLVNAHTPRDVTSSEEPLQALHRRLESEEVYFLFNPASAPVETEVTFRTTGVAEGWNAWTGAAQPLVVQTWPDDRSRLRLSFGPREAKVVVFHRATAPRALAEPASPQHQELLRLEGHWDLTVIPTLDNRFGDFRLPPSREFIGPEARRFRWAEEMATPVRWHEAGFDDSLWPETTCAFGPRFEVLGPLAPGAAPVGDWRPYAFSLRWGIERDPFLTDFLSGPHGLKGRVPDEFLDVHCDQPGREWHLRSHVVVEAAREVTLRAGSRCAYQVWLNDELALEQTDSLPPGRYPPWNIPHYECEPRETRVKLRAGANQLRLKLVQPAGQRTRAFAAFDPPTAKGDDLRLRWFADPASPRPSLPADPERRAVWLRCLAPPGVTGFEFFSRGPARVWFGGIELPVLAGKTLPDGTVRYYVKVDSCCPQGATLAFRVEADREFRAGDVLPEPVRFVCGAGQMPTGDWCAHGLAVYSGIGEYRKSFAMAQPPQSGRLVLDLGDVSATAEVLVNGTRAGVLCAPPWRLEVTELIQPGANTLAIRVANTLANHYSVGIPTPYAFPEQTRSGLLGSVRLIHEHP